MNLCRFTEELISNRAAPQISSDAHRNHNHPSLSATDKGFLIDDSASPFSSGAGFRRRSHFDAVCTPPYRNVFIKSPAAAQADPANLVLFFKYIHLVMGWFTYTMNSYNIWDCYLRCVSKSDPEERLAPDPQVLHKRGMVWKLCKADVPI